MTADALSLDLKLMQGRFREIDFPPDLSYLDYYFQGKLPKALMVFYIHFDELIAQHGERLFMRAFVDHTGLYCSRQRLQYLLKKIRRLMEIDRVAKETMNIELIEKIRLGKWKISHK